MAVPRWHNEREESFDKLTVWWFQEGGEADHTVAKKLVILCVLEGNLSEQLTTRMFHGEAKLYFEVLFNNSMLFVGRGAFFTKAKLLLAGAVLQPEVAQFQRYIFRRPSLYTWRSKSSVDVRRQPEAYIRLSFRVLAVLWTHDRSQSDQFTARHCRCVI